MTARSEAASTVRGVAMALIAWAATAGACAAQGASPILPGGNSREPISITAPTMDYFDRDHVLIYSGGVVAKQGETTLRAASLKIELNDKGASAADLAQGAPNAAGNNQIKRIEASGGVTVNSKSEVGSGDSGVYERASNKLTLIGNVTLSDCANVMKGARLIYDLGAGRAQVLGGTSTLLTPGANCNAGKTAPVAPPRKTAK
jgi:lipopolysaccharide export system protein LptA